MKNCVICESTEYKIIYEIQNYKIVRCRKCGLVRRLKINSEETSYNLYEEDYFKNNIGKFGKDYISEWQNKYDNKKFLEEILEIKKHVPSGAILDIGTGIGNFLQIANSSGYDSTGIEISKFASEFARNKGLKVITGTIEDNISKLGKYDVITMHHFLEHIEDPLNTLKLVISILKDEGIVVIEVPNFNSFRSKINGINWEDLRPNEHIYQFEPKTISLLINKAGFKIIKMKTKTEVLWSLIEPLRLLFIKDDTLKKLENILFHKNKKSINENVNITNYSTFKLKELILLISKIFFYPLAKFYEIIGIEKRLVIFCKKNI